MEDSSWSSGFCGSPVLNKPVEKPLIFQPNNLTLQALYNLLVQQRKKGKGISKKDMKGYYEQVKKVNSRDPKNKRLLMKIQGLCSYILDKRADFTQSVEKGEIVIYKQLPQPPPSPPSSRSQPSDVTFNASGIFLSNYNFVTPMETNADNYSEDMFADQSETFDALYQDYEKFLTNTFLEQEEPVARKISEMSLPDENMAEDVEFCADGASKPRFGFGEFLENIFDDLSVTNDEFKEIFKEELQRIEEEISDVVNSMTDLSIAENLTTFTNVPNETDLQLQSYHSEQNMKIIAEAIEELDKQLKEAMKRNDEDLKFLQEFLPSSQ